MRSAYPAIPSDAPRSRRAFTLIELLAVIAIVAVLFSLTVVVLRTVRTRAKAATAVTQFRHMAAAMLLYTGDNKGYLPGPLASGHNFEYTIRGGNRGTRIHTFLAPYLDITPPPSNGDMLNAKSFMTPAQREWSETPEATANGAPIFFIAYVNGIRPFGNADSGTQPLPLTRVDKPGSTRFLSESDQKAVWVATSNSWYRQIPPSPLHETVRVVSYCDGHVAALKTEESNRAGVQ